MYLSVYLVFTTSGVSDLTGLLRQPPGYVLLGLFPLAAVLLGWTAWERITYAGRGWQSYRVKPGDTLVSLATARGSHWKTIARVNRLRQPYVITAGDELKLPPEARVSDGLRMGGKHVNRKSEYRQRRTAAFRWWWLVVASLGVAAVVWLAVPWERLPPQAEVVPTPVARSPHLPPAPLLATSTAPASAATTSTPPTLTLAKDTLRLSVLNGSGVPGFAALVAAALRQAGYQQVNEGNADTFSYQGLTIRHGPGLAGAAEDVATLLRDRYPRFVLEELATSTAADVTVILGRTAPPPPPATKQR